MQTEKTFDTGELTLRYFEQGAGAPMVLLHGLTSRKENWAPLLPELSAHWHIYAPDLRGHGTSDRAPDDHYANADYARDIVAFLKFIGEPAVVMGHSLGAMTAIVAAADYSEHMRGVILGDPPLSTWNTHIDPKVGPGAWFTMVYEMNSASPTFDGVVARLRAAMPDADDKTIRGMADSMYRVAPGTVKAALDDVMWAGRDLPHDLQSIQCPMLMIHGDLDQGGAMRDEDIALFKANAPSATVVRIVGADHGLKMNEQPDMLLGHVNTFLQSI
jgi:pimeloyl-ACP methyl ester carboxylesterase